jgi:hypothetical protein
MDPREDGGEPHNPGNQSEEREIQSGRIARVVWQGPQNRVSEETQEEQESFLKDQNEEERKEGRKTAASLPVPSMTLSTIQPAIESTIT